MKRRHPYKQTELTRLRKSFQQVALQQKVLYLAITSRSIFFYHTETLKH